ncbi:MAG TPA: hypothetical protein VEK08_05420 [Planctomycetota bacterium]|nr:hypothetical protein [Planctomycetota bacterium]
MLSLALAANVSAEETTKLNAEKYPQDTPQNAVKSILKALESRDFDYWISWLVTPAAQRELIERHGSLNSAVLFNADDRHVPRIKAQIEAIRKLREANQTSEGEDNGVKWFRYSGDGRVIQFERQADGRWCMSRTAKEPAK